MKLLSKRLLATAARTFLCASAPLALSACEWNAGAEARLAAGKPCYVEGVSSRAACYTMPVPEDWAKPDGRKIALNVAVLPATGVNRDGSALFVLAGGPGQAATHLGDLMTRELDRVRATRPVILMDARGTGGSNGLRCNFGGTTLAEVQAQSSASALQECRRSWSKAALQHYSTPDVVRDMETVRSRLGFEKLDLWGGSWGTRTALLYMREYPQNVRSAVLDGVTGPNAPLFLGEAGYAQAALDRLLRDCAADKACAAAFPNLAAQTGALLQADAPRTVQYVDANGRPTTTTLEPDTLRQIVRGALYSPEGAARLPLALDRLASGDAAPILALANSAAGLIRETMFHGATFSSLCAEEMPRTSPEAAARASAGSFARDSFYKPWAEGCQGWPVKPLPAGYDRPVTANVPVLLLSGGLDPVTPPASAEEVRKHLPRAWHIVAPTAGHNVTAMPCAGRVIAAFVSEADGSRLDASCLTRPKRPPFIVSPLGPEA